ncbi:MAG: hypothetical protein ABR593_04890 [Candidatus Limnocylindria bacterium]
MTEPAFAPETLARLRNELEVRIETFNAEGNVQRTIIWVVVDASERVLIRSYRGAGHAGTAKRLPPAGRTS